MDCFRLRSLSYGGHVVAEPVIGPRVRADPFAPRNDEGHATPRSRGMICPSFAKHHPRKSEGAGNAGCSAAPAALRAKESALCAREAITGQPKQPAFPARWFMAYSALSPVSGLLATVACERVARKLDLSNGRPGPRGFAIRTRRRSSHASPRVHRSPLPTSVTVATPLFSGGGMRGIWHDF
jgi:hypothetical protein